MIHKLFQRYRFFLFLLKIQPLQILPYISKDHQKHVITPVLERLIKEIANFDKEEWITFQNELKNIVDLKSK